MKRFVFINKTSTIPDQNGSVIKLRASSLELPDLQIPGEGEATFLSFPLALKTENDEPDFQLMFRLTPKLIASGVMLGGAYREGDYVRSSLINFGKTIAVKEKEVVLEAVLVEDVKFFQRTPEEMNKKALTTLTAIRKPKRK